MCKNNIYKKSIVICMYKNRRSYDARQSQDITRIIKPIKPY